MSTILQVAASFLDTLFRGVEVAVYIIATVFHINYMIVSNVITGIISMTCVIRKTSISFALACFDTLDSAFRLCQDLVDFTINFVVLLFNIAYSIVEFAVIILQWIVSIAALILSAIGRLLSYANIHLETILEVAKGMLMFAGHYSWLAVGKLGIISAVIFEELSNHVVAFGIALVWGTKFFLHYIISGITTVHNETVMMWTTVSDFYSSAIIKLWKNAHRSGTFAIDTIGQWIIHIYSVVIPGIPMDVYVVIVVIAASCILYRHIYERLESRGFNFPGLYSWTQTNPFAQAEQLPPIVGEDGDEADVNAAPGDENQDSDHEDELSMHNHERSSSPVVEVDNMSHHELSLALENERDRRLCVICQCETKDILLLPCRHMCLCQDCARQISRTPLRNRRVCPLCRTQIEAVMSIYV